MENKLYDKNCITLDGRLDEPVWETAEAYTGFKKLVSRGATPAPAQATFRILPCEDRIYFGIRCDEPDIDKVVQTHPTRSKWCTDSVEFFMSPSGDSFEFYQFLVTMGNHTSAIFHSESGNIHPDPYEPQWRHATYVGENYWSAEIELPLTAFYMTTNACWSSKWLLNVCRTRSEYYPGGSSLNFYTWSDLVSGFVEPTNFRSVEGFPARPAENDIRMSTAAVQISGKTEDGFVGNLVVNVTSPVDADFEFISESTGTVDVSLKVGENEMVIPCCFPKEGRQKVDLELKRKADGVSFKRWYPVRVTYEPIKLNLTLPEYRGNFYPGQDYSKVAGTVSAAKPVTVTLEGPGIGTKTVKPEADGSFVIETPEFEYGDAMLTITDSVNTLTRKIRRLVPSEHTMSWISGGNLVVNGKPTLRRNMYAEYYHGGEAFQLKYDADNLHITKEVRGSKGFITPGRLMKGADAPGGEATFDQKPSDEMYRRFAEVIENNRGRDFVFYYLDDEPECRGVSPVYLKHLYDFISDLDPYHVILIGTRSAGSMVDCADWFECHPYINVQVRDGKRYCARPINTMANFVEEVLSINRTDKCVGFLPTCFAYKYQSVYSEYPNFDEMICHTWAAMLPGAKSLWPYAYHDLNDRAALYEGIRYIFSTFEALEDLVLMAKRTELIRNQNVHAVHYELNGEEMFVLVNLVDEPQSVTLDGISGTWHNFRHGGTITGNSFSLKPYEVVIGTSKVRDAGLPTYQETVALVDKLEYERTHGGSLLFDRYRDIAVTASVPTSKYKLFDGVRDNYAWECNGKDKFFEMDLTKIKPTFSKVVISGFQIDDMEIKVRNNGELSVPAIKEVKNEQFSKTFYLAEPICPDCLRLEFGEHRVELYEIEAF
ncbi:MAG: hypothetical protein IJX37_02835 [Oscillospiraceae bacterium]|nr:hypothetical protein [Oscillospiraceae bacterium]